MITPGWRVEILSYAGREQWLDMRRADITASDAGALFGEHKYQTPRKMALEKAYGENRPQTAPMRRGKIMEPAVAEAVLFDFGWELHRCKTYLRARADDPMIRMGATRDYMLSALSQEALLESRLRDQALALGWDEHAETTLSVQCKSVDPYVFEQEWGEHPPKYILIQAAMEAMLADADGALVACLVETRNRDLYLYAVPRRHAFEVELTRRVADFWASFTRGDEFPVSAGDNAGMAALYPEAETEQVVDLSSEPIWHQLASERHRLNGDIDKLETRVSEIEAKFKDRMREASKAILPGWTVTWKTDARGARRFRCERVSARSK